MERTRETPSTRDHFDVSFSLISIFLISKPCTITNEAPGRGCTNRPGIVGGLLNQHAAMAVRRHASPRCDGVGRRSRRRRRRSRVQVAIIGSKIVNKSGQGFWLDIALGIVGEIVGGFLFSAVFGMEGITGLHLEPDGSNHWFYCGAMGLSCAGGPSVMRNAARADRSRAGRIRRPVRSGRMAKQSDHSPYRGLS